MKWGKERERTSEVNYGWEKKKMKKKWILKEMERFVKNMKGGQR